LGNQRIEAKRPLHAQSAFRLGHIDDEHLNQASLPGCQGASQPAPNSAAAQGPVTTSKGTSERNHRCSSLGVGMRDLRLDLECPFTSATVS